MSSIVHACDISNPTMQFEDFREWGLRITQEFDDLFNAETNLKEQRNTPDPLPFMKYNGYEAFKNGQIGFTSKLYQI
jgi:cAMP-specific phosphodiesterase 4